MRLRKIIAGMAAVASVSGVMAVAPGGGGVVDAATYPGCKINRTVKHRSTGDSVNCVEKALQAKGYLSKYVNTYFGTATVHAVKNYQRSNGLYVDGVVGKQTAQHLGIWGSPTSGGSSTPSTPASSGTYTVKRGDTLYGISRKTGTPLSTLYSLNGLNSRSIIRPGQVLKTKGTATTPPATTPPATTPPATTPAPSCNVSRTLSRYARGNDVNCLEKTLKAKGFQSSYIDTYYGTTTVRAVKNFQARNGLSQTGKADQATLKKLGVWKAPAPVRGWNGTDGDCGMNPRGRSAVANRQTQRVWLCDNGTKVRGPMPFTAGPINDAPKGNYSVFFKRYTWWGGGYTLRHFTAFTRGDQGGRVAFHKYVNMPESKVGSEQYRNASAGCFRMKASDAGAVYNFLGYGDKVTILNNG